MWEHIMTCLEVKTQSLGLRTWQSWLRTLLRICFSWLGTWLWTSVQRLETHFYLQNNDSVPPLLVVSFLRIHTQQRAEQWELRHIQIKHITQLFDNTPHHTTPYPLNVQIMTVSQGVYSVFSSIHQWVMWLINITKTKYRQHHNYLFKCSFNYS